MGLDARGALRPPSAAMIRHLLLGSALALTATAALPQGEAPMPARPAASAEARTRAALRADRGAQPAPQRGDRDRSDRARSGARARPDPARARAAVRHADPDQGQYRDRRAAADDGGEPRAGQQRHRPRRASGGAAARGGRGDRRQGESLRMGEHPLVRFDLGLERDRRPGAQSLCAQPQPLRVELGQRGGGRLRHGPGRDRHRDRRLDHLPGGDQRHRRLQAQRRPGQPHPCRADQPQPGHARADDADGARRGAGHERDRRHRSRRSGHRRGRPAAGRLYRRPAAPTRCAGCGSA